MYSKIPYFHNGDNVTIYYPDYNNNLDPFNVLTSSIIRSIITRKHIEHLNITFQKLFADDLDEAVYVQQISYKSMFQLRFGNNVGAFKNGSGVICSGLKSLTTHKWQIIRHNDGSGSIKKFEKKRVISYGIKLENANQDMNIWHNKVLVDSDGVETTMQNIQKEIVRILKWFLYIVKKQEHTLNFKLSFVTPKVLVSDDNFPITLYCTQPTKQYYLRNICDQCNVANVTLPTNSIVYGFKLWEYLEESKESVWAIEKYVYHIHLANLNYVYVSNRDDASIPLIKAEDYIVGTYTRPLYYVDRIIVPEEIIKISDFI